MQVALLHVFGEIEEGARIAVFGLAQDCGEFRRCDADGLGKARGRAHRDDGGPRDLGSQPRGPYGPAVLVEQLRHHQVPLVPLPKVARPNMAHLSLRSRP